MKASSTALLLAAALGVSAHPSRHGHQHFHRSAKPTEFFNSYKPLQGNSDNSIESPEANVVGTGSSVPATATGPDSKPTDDNAAPPQESSAPGAGYGNGSDGSSFGEGLGTFQPLCAAIGKRATVAQVHAAGNLGDGEYGCNVKTIKSNIADKYDYTILFDNVGNKQQDCACWLKIGKDQGVNGAFKNNEIFHFNMGPNGKQYVAIDPNSKGSCSCGAGTLQTTSYGQWAGTWVEWDMGSKDNGGYSGADASALVASSQPNLDIPGLKVCEESRPESECSIIYSGGKGRNAYVKGTNNADGIGLNLEPGKVRLRVSVDYQGN